MIKWGKRLLCMALTALMALSCAACAKASGIDEGMLAGMKTAYPNLICSDIIAGIDLSSVTVDGNVTLFSSVMSDGAVVRFEGTNIAVTENGITMQAESRVVSLDALGTIYLYAAAIQDGAKSPVSAQWLDVGYGYTDAADKTSVERAEAVFADPFAGYDAAAWNAGNILPMDDLQPNYAFFMAAAGNTADITVTSLTVGYDPVAKHTDISVPRQAMPAYFEHFEAFFAAQNAVNEAPVYEEPVYEEPYEEPCEEPYYEEPALEENNQPEEPYTQLNAKMAEPGTLNSDIVAGIDRSSINTNGAITYFNAVMSDGTVIRFEGENIAITEEGIVFAGSTSRVTMLDAVGKIYAYQLYIKDGEQKPISDQWLCVDYGYTLNAEVFSIENGMELRMLSGPATSAEFWNTMAPTDTTAYEPNFLCLYGLGANTESITLTSLNIGYQPAQRYTAPEEIRAAMPDNFLLGYVPSEEDDMTLAGNGGVLVSEDGQVALGIPAIEDPAQDYGAKKLAEAGVCYSDIVAGIDRGSVRTQGDTTFFSAVMSDGAVVRFAGENIAVTNDGIVMKANSTLTSLDAVGKIYEYTAAVKDHDAAPVSEQTLNVNYAYTFSAQKTSVDSADALYTSSISGLPVSVWSSDYQMDVAIYSPNFVSVSAASYNTADFTLTSLTIGYNPNSKVTAITGASLNAADYGYYAEGELYAASREDKADASQKEYEFYLRLKLETQNEAGMNDTDSYLHFVPKKFYTVGDLKDVNGNVLDKATARIYAGSTLDVTIGDYAMAVKLPMATLLTGAQTLNEARPYSTLAATGAQHSLVIPVVWADQTGMVSDALYADYQKALGRMIDRYGNALGDCSDANDQVFSLSEYFDRASYGQLEISSFMTDWYYTDKTFSGDYEFIFPEVEFAAEVLQWVKATYPDIDWTQFDQDGDGVVDSIVLISVGQRSTDSYTPASFGGAVHSTGNNFGKLAGTQQDPQANCFLTVNHSFLAGGNTNTLIHEFSHNFGLNDYYDGTTNGVNAVGGYDMESNSVGDWNAYSKLAVGWMEPQVMSGLASGESVDVTIGSSALAGDVIILPTAGTEYTGPFGEYVMIDLLSPDGVNAYAAAEYGLQSTVGVRISHVNAALKRMTESDTIAVGYIEDNGNVIGMELYSNNYNDRGLYNIEVIQSGRKNTFTSLNSLYPYLRADDLFYAGDTFAAQDYTQFFAQGLMDNGMPLGYTVTVLSIGTDAAGNPSATIRITAD